MKILLALVLCFMSVSKILAQDTAACNGIYTKVDQEAAYAGRASDRSFQLQKTIFPALNQCKEETGLELGCIFFTFLINEKGKIVNVEIEKNELPAKTLDSLRQSLTNMKGWLPAKIKGEPVCSYLKVPLPCLYWIEEP